MTAQELPALPRWLQDILPTPREPLVITHTDQGFLLTHSVIQPEIFPTLENAFHVGVHEYAAAYTETIGGITFEGNLPPQYSSIGGIFVTSQTSGSLMLFYDDHRSYESLQNAYSKWLVMYEQYFHEPENFTNAYFFLDLHPRSGFAVHPTQLTMQQNRSYGKHINTFQTVLYTIFSLSTNLMYTHWKQVPTYQVTM